MTRGGGRTGRRWRWSSAWSAGSGQQGGAGTRKPQEKRAAAAIQWIDSECSIVPFGAFIKTAGGEIKNAPNYSGLSTEDAGKLASYLHFRVPVNARSPLERAQQDKATDFLDLLTDDIPKVRCACGLHACRPVWIRLRFRNRTPSPFIAALQTLS